MKDALINLLAIVLLAFGALMLMLGSLLGQQRRVAPWLVRGKYWLLDVLDGRRRINITQPAILILGAVGATLIVLGGELSRWGYLISLLGQPFWINVFWRERKLGMLAMSLYFSVVWGAGVAFSWGWL